jgi:hypothetical protein
MRHSTPVCLDEHRRREVRAQEEQWNGLDYVEVEVIVDETGKHCYLKAYFLNQAPSPSTIGPENVLIEESGRPGVTLGVIGVKFCPAKEGLREDYLRIEVNPPADPATYILRLVEAETAGEIQTEAGASLRHRPLHEIDSRYASVAFRFPLPETSDLDCRHVHVCPAPALAEPPISYLAKDYESFRSLIFDRLAQIMPDWQERHVPDLGVALVELLAYEGDRLSYYQDAVATEAYLDTARQRISVRRHARLVDYRLHEGCNARAYVFVKTNQDAPPVRPDEIWFVTGAGVRQPENDFKAMPDLEAPWLEDGETFEPLCDPGENPVRPIRLYAAHDEIQLYTWGNERCCLPRGATSATLIDDARGYDWEKHAYLHSSTIAEYKLRALPDAEVYDLAQADVHDWRRILRLEVGDFLLFEETVGPQTGKPADADPTHRHIVRLTEVQRAVDRLTDVSILEVAWKPEDALPFLLCISTLGPPERQCALLKNVSVARGNVILADHGRTLRLDPDQKVLREDLGVVPQRDVQQACEGEGELSEVAIVPAKFEPVLQVKHLAHRQPLPAVDRTAAGLLKQDPREAVPCIQLWSIPPVPGKAVPLFEPDDLDDPTSLARRLKVVLHTRPHDHHDSHAASRHHPAEGRRRDEWQELDDLTRLLESEHSFDIAGLLALVSPDTLPIWRQFGAEQLSTPQAESLHAGLRQLQRHTWAMPKEERQDVISLMSELRSDRWFDRACLCSCLSLQTLWLLKKYDGGYLPSQLRQALLRDLRRLLRRWDPQLDLLGSRPADRHFVVEMDNERLAHLRFGDGQLGCRPEAGERFVATYRVGEGAAGNVGAGAISVARLEPDVDGLVLWPRNPLSAQGGMTPEPLGEGKLYAPYTFDTRLERAITGDDYREIVLRDFKAEVQGAAAVVNLAEARPGGRRHEVHVWVDPLHRAAAPDDLRDRIKLHLERYRRIGHRVTVGLAQYVPLKIKLLVHVKPDYLEGEVKAALLAALGNRRLPDGRLGFFHPDRWTFGEDVYLSQLVAAAQAVPGVARIEAQTFRPRAVGATRDERIASVISIGESQVARLDNDPENPGNGELTLEMDGGR